MSPNKKVGAGLVLASASLLAILEVDEGFRATPYRDTGGVWTVCQGITGKEVVLGKTYSKSECRELFEKHIVIAGKGVIACTKVPLKQHQYDAFVRFTYNVGVSAFCNSTLARKLNAGDYAGACNQLNRWVYVRGEKVKGLVNRRRSEYQMCAGLTEI